MESSRIHALLVMRPPAYVAVAVAATAVAFMSPDKPFNETKQKQTRLLALGPAWAGLTQQAWRRPGPKTADCNSNTYQAEPSLERAE